MKKTAYILKFVIVCLLTGLFVWFGINCIIEYKSYDVTYDDLIYEELTFKDCESVRMYKSGLEYLFYFQEYDKPFVVTSITKSKLNLNELDKISEGTVLKIYYRKASLKRSDREVCEIKTNSSTILSLNGYIKANKNNQMIGMIICPILALCGVFLIVCFINPKTRWMFFNARQNRSNCNY